MRSAFLIVKDGVKTIESSGESCEKEGESSQSAKRVKRCTSFSDKYTEKYAFIKPCSDEMKAFCEICKTNFGCKYGGLNDVVNLFGTLKGLVIRRRQRNVKISMN